MFAPSRAQPRFRSISVGVFCVLATQGCFGLFKPQGGYQGSKGAGYEGAMASAQQSGDDRVVASLEQARKKMKGTPGGVDEARVFAQNVQGVFELGVVKRKGLDGAALLAEASDGLEASVVAFPDKKPEAMFSKGTMLLAAGKTEEGIVALRASMNAKASPRACISLIGELDKQGDPKKEILGLCKKARVNAASDETRFALLESCIQHSHAKNADDGLKWAGAADVTFYKDYSKKLQAESEQRRRDEEAQAERRRASMDAERARDDERRAQQSSSSQQSHAPSAPSGWHLSLKNSCPKTVKLFLGNKPKFGSGTSTSLSSNTISSYSGSAGDMIWIIGEQENGLSSLSPSGNQTMQILPGCTGFGPY